MEPREIFEMKEIFGLAGVPLIMALVELVKRSWPGMAPELAPGLAILFGILVNGALGYYLQVDGFVAVIVGIVAGLAASGLYSGGKGVIETQSPPRGV